MKTIIREKTIIGMVLLFLFLGSNGIQAASVLGDRFEVALGGSAVAELVKQYGGVYAIPVQQRLWLEEIFRRLVENTERKELEYSLTVLDSKEYNAFALPGGFVFLTRGLLNALDPDADKLAAVLGHEIAHVEKKHGLNAVLRQMSLTFLVEVGLFWIDSVPTEVLRLAGVTLLQLLQMGWGREAEYEADLLGQHLAIAAGFDGIGAVSALDELLTMDPQELSPRLFRSHPETIERRQRVEENLVSYWSEPEVVPEAKLQEIIEIGRTLGRNGRTDPQNRFVLQESFFPGFAVYDQQRESIFVWLKDGAIKNFAWRPGGKHVAVLLEIEGATELKLFDRYGHVVQSLMPNERFGQIEDFCWSPEGEMLALQFSKEEQDQIVVTSLAASVFLPVGQGVEPTWTDYGLCFHRDAVMYLTKPPLKQQVVIPNPVPQVLQRHRILSPTIVQEDNTIRLTRPALVY